jgi:hypothetical protein
MKPPRFWFSAMLSTWVAKSRSNPVGTDCVSGVLLAKPIISKLR